MKTPLSKTVLLTIGLLVTAATTPGCFGENASVRAAETAPAVATTPAMLRVKVKAAGDFAEEKYDFASWNALRFAMDGARRVADNAGATPDELNAAAADLGSKIDALQTRPIAPARAPQIALSASLFATNTAGPVNNVALMWATTAPDTTVEIYRASEKSANFTRIFSGKGASFNDYNLPNGAYSYKMTATQNGQTMTSPLQRVTTLNLPVGTLQYSNQMADSLSLGEPLKAGKTFYRFDAKRDGKTGSYTVSTSLDGKNWTQGPVVLDASDHPDLDDYKFEANNIFYDATHDQIVWWGHWERSKGYNDGRAFVATAKPGGRFTVHHIYNPLGVQVRDMSVFIDDDKQGYLVAASNVVGQGANATLTIFKMNADYTDVTGIINKAMEGGYREAPHIIKNDGFYTLFFSQAAGWYPSRAGYVSAKSLDGNWSEVRDLGNSSTFSAQSGGILDFGAKDGAAKDKLAPLLMANRWIRGDGTSRNAVVPLHCANGFVFGDYAPTLLVNRAQSLVVPLESGVLLSQNQPSLATIPGTKDHEIGMAFDGDYSTAFISDQKTWPFAVTTDLGAPSRVRNVQISWHIHKGSEAYYKYIIEGSADGQNWNVLLDKTDDQNTLVSKTYGFTSDLLPATPTARYVRVNVRQAVLQNNPNNWYSPTLYEVKVYGDKLTR